MSISSAFRSAWPFSIGLVLFAASCGVATPEVSFDRVDSTTVEVMDEPAEQTNDVDNSESGNSEDGLVPVTAPSADQGTDGSDGTNGSDDPAPAPEGLNGLADTEFCSESADYWVAANAGNSINMYSETQLRLVFEQMAIELDEAITAAPNEELEEPAIVARDHFVVIAQVLVDFDWDYAALEETVTYSELQPHFTAMGEIDDLLQEYLAGPCAFSEDDLDRRAEETGQAIINRAADLDAAQQDIPDGEFIEIVDGTDRLKVNVPYHWEDVQSEPDGPQSSLIIAPNVSEYLTTWAADGLKMTVKNAPAAIDWRQPMYETNAANECTLVSSNPYSDSLYTGWIDHYNNCGNSTASGTAVVIGATDADLSVEILVEVQFDTVDTADDAAILAEILDSFKAR